MTLQLDLKSGVLEPRPLAASRLIIAGWVGRDGAAVQHHIDELGRDRYLTGLLNPPSSPRQAASMIPS